MPTPRLECAFGIDANTDPAAGDWVDISDRVRSFDVSGGRQDILDKVEAGVATFVLDNRDRALDSENVDGPYYPNVVPMAHVRFFEDDTGSPVFRGFADRWPQSWPSKADAIVTLTATDAFKVFAKADLPESLWELEIRATTPRAWWRLGDPENATTAVDSSSNGHHASTLGSPRFGQEGLLPSAETGVTFPANGDKIVAPGAASLNENNWTIEFLVRRPPIADLALSVNGEAILHMDDGSSRSFINVRHANDPEIQCDVQINSVTFAQVFGGLPGIFDDKPHHVMIQRAWNGATGTLKIFVDRIEMDSTALNTAAVPSTPMNSVTIGHDPRTASTNYRGTLQELVVYDDSSNSAAEHAEAALSPFAGFTTDEAITRILDHLVWPAGLRNLRASDSTLQAHGLGGKALTYFHRLNETEEGRFYISADGKVTFHDRDWEHINNESQATFGDDPDDATETPYIELVLDPADEEKVHNQARVGREGGTVHVIDDATSQARYFTRTIDRTDLLHETDNETIDHGNHLVNRFKDPKAEVRSLTVKLADPRVSVAEVLALTFGDLVTVVRRPLDTDGNVVGAPIERTVRVEGVTHSADRDPATWQVTLSFSGWDAEQDQALILDDAEFGILDSNRLGF
ncbi:MAG: hypothetical protein WEB06_12020 [Actinomycetota bacterium]